MAQGPTHPEPVLYLLGQTLRQYRNKSNMSQKALAKIVHVTAEYIGEVERGQRNVSILVLLRVAVALQIPLVDILQPLAIHPELFQKASPRSD
jgi:transcriptional regulator with XRE-family HTH domain